MAIYGDLDREEWHSLYDLHNLLSFSTAVESRVVLHPAVDLFDIHPYSPKVQLRLDGTAKYLDKKTRRVKRTRWRLQTGWKTIKCLKLSHLYNLPYLFELERKVEAHLRERAEKPWKLVCEEARVLLGEDEEYSRTIFGPLNAEGRPEFYVRIFREHGSRDIGLSWSWLTGHNDEWYRLTAVQRLAAMSHADLADRIKRASCRLSAWWSVLWGIRTLLQADIDRRARKAMDEGLIATAVYSVKYRDQVWAFYPAPSRYADNAYFVKLNQLPDVLDLNEEVEP